MKKLRIALCDDERQHLQYTAELVRALLTERGYSPEMNCFEESLHLLEAVETGGFAPELAVLDVEMNGMDGVALAKRLNGLLPLCAIIFLTGHSGHESEVYEAEHSYYVTKDRVEQYMGRALDKTLSRLEQADSRLTLHVGSSLLTLPTEQLIYAESARRKVCVHTAERDYELNEKLDELEGRLPEKDFVRCHQSFLVNLRYVTGLRASTLLLTNGDALPVSRARLSETRSRVLEF